MIFPFEILASIHISDADWAKIAGPRITEKYLIEKGDSLSKISKRLFGDQKYWPKIWELNNLNIKNPHFILPGQAIAFSAGNGTHLPSIEIEGQSAASATDAPDPDGQIIKKSMQWKELPRQRWDNEVDQLYTNVDKNLFDISSTTKINTSVAFNSSYIPTSHKLDLLGKIIGSNSQAQLIGITELVYIKSTDPLQVGETYAVTTDDPVRLESHESHRRGYVYPIFGTVKIQSVQENIYLGTVTSETAPIVRNSYLIPLPPIVPELTPIPGPQPLRGFVLVNKSTSNTISMSEQVYVDRGSEDSIQPGMIFRIFQTDDPQTKKTFTKSSFIFDADIMITQVSESFSSGMVIHATQPLSSSAEAVLLTDLTDFMKKGGVSSVGGDGLDELDKIDNNDTPGTKESNEIKQLENWKADSKVDTKGINPPVHSSPTPLEKPAMKPSPLPTEPTPPLSEAPTEVAPTEADMAPPVNTAPPAPAAELPATEPPTTEAPATEAPIPLTQDLPPPPLGG